MAEQLGKLRRGLSQLSEREERLNQQHLEFLNRFEENHANFIQEGREIHKGLKRLDSSESQNLEGFFSSMGNFGGQSGLVSSDQAFARLAFIFLVVHVAGGLVLTAFYYNFAAFEVYIMSLFWAMIISIPLYQVKMTIMRLIFSRLLCETYMILEVLSGQNHHRCRVLIRKLPLCHWLYMDEAVEREQPEEQPQAPLEAFIDKDAGDEVRKGLMEGKSYHATILTSARHPSPRIEDHWEQRHFLGPLRPYSGWKDLLRDLPSLFRGAMALVWFMLKPYQEFSSEADSSPYFGLLLRLCALQLLYKIWSRELQERLLMLAILAYVVVVLLRVAAWLVGFCAPFVWSKIPLWMRQAWQQARQHLRRKLGGRVSNWLQARWDKAVKGFEENCHFLLSMLIILAASVLTVYLMSFLILSLRDEALVIHRTFHELLQKQEAYQSVMEQLDRVGSTDGGLVGTLLAQLEESLPDYEKMLARHVPDFYILKYLLHDIWNDNVGEIVHKQGPSPDMTLACQDAVAHGASCHAEETIVMQHALRNTTAVLHGLVAGNWTDIASLLSGAYSEVSSISSLLKGDSSQSSAAEALKDGAAYGGTLFVQLTYFLPRVLLDLLSSASCALGQFVVFMTALFYLLSAEESCLAVVGEFLRVVDHKQVIFKITERVMRAVLVSAMKMSAFHALFTWLLYSFGQLPIVVVPTVLSAILALVPKVSPVWSVSFWAAVYLWLHGKWITAAVYLLLNVAVWWQVPTVIYAEIPEANAWLTGLGVVLGVGQFGLAGVVLGPLLASVRLICYNLVKLFNTLQWQQATETPAKRRSLFTLHEDFLPNATSPRGSHASMRSPSSSETESVEPQASLNLSPSHAQPSASSPERSEPEEAPVRRRNRSVRERVAFSEVPD